MNLSLRSTLLPGLLPATFHCPTRTVSYLAQSLHPTVVMFFHRGKSRWITTIQKNWQNFLFTWKVDGMITDLKWITIVRTGQTSIWWYKAAPVHITSSVSFSQCDLRHFTSEVQNYPTSSLHTERVTIAARATGFHDTCG
jgi:hypothetical protein